MLEVEDAFVSCFRQWVRGGGRGRKGEVGAGRGVVGSMRRGRGRREVVRGVVRGV
jgi:hypothetical protein